MNNKFDALKNDDSGEDETEQVKPAINIELDPSEKDLELPPPPDPDEHQLQFAYALWFSRRAGGKQVNAQPYDQNLKMIGTFNTDSLQGEDFGVELPKDLKISDADYADDLTVLTNDIDINSYIRAVGVTGNRVERFWALYSHLVRPSDMASHSDFHLFKYGIKPMWEDEANKAGGKWIVRLRKGLASRCWENLILAILGEQFMVGEEICGAVISIRFQEDIISVWNKTASDQATTIRIRDTLKRVLNLPPHTIMEYKTHNDSMRDNSSFRNTDVFLR